MGTPANDARQKRPCVSAGLPAISGTRESTGMLSQFAIHALLGIAGRLTTRGAGAHARGSMTGSTRVWCLESVLLVMLVMVGVEESRGGEIVKEDRVQAHGAIEEVYRSWREVAVKESGKAVPRAVLQDRVAKYMEQSTALREYWHTAVTSEMLARETRRMIDSTPMPNRLRELFPALGNDRVLVEECLARPILVGRLSRNFFAWDERIHARSRHEADDLRGLVLGGLVDPYDAHPSRSVVEWFASDSGASGKRGIEVGPEERHRIALTAGEYVESRSRLPRRIGEVGQLVETREAFGFQILLREKAPKREPS